MSALKSVIPTLDLPVFVDIYYDINMDKFAAFSIKWKFLLKFLLKS